MPISDAPTIANAETFSVRSSPSRSSSKLSETKLERSYVASSITSEGQRAGCPSSSSHRLRAHGVRARGVGGCVAEGVVRPQDVLGEARHESRGHVVLED